MPIIVAKFDNAVVTVNPGGCCVANLPDSYNGLYNGNYPGNTHIGDGGPNPGCPACPNPPDLGAIEIEYQFFAPVPVASKVRLWNNGGGDLFDFDGFATFDYVLFDNLNVIVGSGTMNAGNGFNPFNDDFGIAQNIQRMVISNFTTQTPNRPHVWWREIELLIPDADCVPATDITMTSATMNAQTTSVSAGNFYKWFWSETSGGEDHQSPFISTTGADPDNISFPATGLKPGTTYFYRVCIYDGDGFQANGQEVTPAENYNSFPICSEECSFTTLPGVWYCGMLFDPSDCFFVQINEDEGYFYCLDT